MANIVNGTFVELFTPPVFWYATMAFTIFAIYLLLSTLYLLICKEEIWANPFFRPVATTTMPFYSKMFFLFTALGDL